MPCSISHVLIGALVSASLMACAMPPQKAEGPGAGGREQAPSLPANPTPEVAVATLTAPARQAAPRTQIPQTFAGWSAMIIAGDNHAGDGGTTDAFDNARAAVTQQLVAWGFPEEDVRQYTVTPDRFPETGVRRTRLSTFSRELAQLKMGTAKGCLFYLTSHGTRAGVVFNDQTLSPQAFWETAERLCTRQPIIAVVSACHSGVFAAPEWQRTDRMILTAARADRTSFGCGQDNVYPYFDGCFLEAAQGAHDWLSLADKTRTCVARRENEAGLTPSEPQLFVGARIAENLRARRLSPRP